MKGKTLPYLFKKSNVQIVVKYMYTLIMHA